MMTKEEHIKHWLKSADEDMKDVNGDVLIN